jgi:hypothetical protein
VRERYHRLDGERLRMAGKESGDFNARSVDSKSKQVEWSSSPKQVPAFAALPIANKTSWRLIAILMRIAQGIIGVISPGGNYTIRSVRHCT